MAKAHRDTHRRLVKYFAVAIAVLLTTTSAWAAPTSKLTYVRGPGTETCPSEEELRAAVAARVGYDPFFPHAERVIITEIERTESDAYRANIRIADGAGHLLGQRRIGPAADCGELMKSVALAVSVAIDDVDMGAPPESASEPAREPAPQSAPETGSTFEAPIRTAKSEPNALSPLPADRPAKISAIRMRASLGVLGAFGAAPALSFGGVVGAGVRATWWSASIEGRADVPSSKALEGGGRIESSLAVASLVPCVRLASKLTPYACVVGSVGVLRAAATEVTVPASASALSVWVGGRVGAEMGVADHIAVYAQIDAAGTSTRHRLALSGTTVYEFAPAQVSAGAGVAVLFF